MHGLLAISALHYAHTHPECYQEFIIRSSAYQNLALQHFSSNLHDINEGNCVAFFLLASLIAVASIASVANPCVSETAVAASDAARCFSLLQGVKNILDFKPLQSWRLDGTLAPLLCSFGPPMPKKSLTFHRRMEKVAGLARELSPELTVINERSACLLARESLRSAHLATADEHSPTSAHQVWSWALTLPPLFIEMLGNNHPVALIILAHFAALARPLEHRDWITRGWSASVLSLVESVLVNPWRKWIRWPSLCLTEGKSVDDMDEDE